MSARSTGGSFVIVRRNVLAESVSHVYYLDLARLSHLQDQRNTPFTPAVHVHYALAEALREFEEAGGWTARHRHYARLAEQVRAGLPSLGIRSVPTPEQSSVVQRAYRLPDAMSYHTLHDALKTRGFVIYAGQGALAASLFRISTMGCLTVDDMDRLLRSCPELL